jgi:hypothetical protein
MRELRKSVADSVDIASITPELIEFPEEPLFAHGSGCFEHLSYRRRDGSGYRLDHYLAAEVKTRAKRLQAADRAVKELLLHHGNLVSAEENIRLQSQMGWLTIVMLALTVVTTVLTGVTVYQAFTTERSQGVPPQN